MRCSLALLFALTSTALLAQTPATPAPAFEVASVRPNKSGTTQTTANIQADGVNFVNLPLRAIIQLAYGINQPAKLIGLPDWAVTERYDIAARAGRTIPVEEARLMLQALLAERFKLIARREKREISVLALMLARTDGKLGANLAESKGCTDPRAIAAGNATKDAATPVCGARPGGAGKLTLVGVPMQQLTGLLGVMLGTTVVDKTGLTGRYDMELTYTPDRPAPANPNIPGPAADPNGPSIYTALREQLGLKLESQRDQEEILVIDSVQRQPTAN